MVCFWEGPKSTVRKMSEVISCALVLLRFIVRQWYLFILYPCTVVVLTQGPFKDKATRYSVVIIVIAVTHLT